MKWHRARARGQLHKYLSLSGEVEDEEDVRHGASFSNILFFSKREMDDLQMSEREKLLRPIYDAL